MPSLQSQLVYLLMKNRHLLKGRIKQEAWDFNTSIPKWREDCERTNRRMASRLPEGIEVRPDPLGALHAEWLIPDGAPLERAILYTIGGGYISGNCADHRTLVAKIARGTGVPVYLFDHRLAPEHPFPAALDDTLAAYDKLIKQGIPPQKIMIVGESAGGGLCLAALLAIRDSGRPLPAAAVALSPWTDLALTGESHRTKAKVCLSPPGMSQVCMHYYIGEGDPRNSYISPLYGDLHGLPPLLLQVGEYETLLDDTTRFAEKARAAGVDVTLRVGAKMVHCYALMSPMFPEAVEAMGEIVGFVKEHIGMNQGRSW